MRLSAANCAPRDRPHGCAGPGVPIACRYRSLGPPTARLRRLHPPARRERTPCPIRTTRSSSSAPARAATWPPSAPRSWASRPPWSKRTSWAAPASTGAASRPRRGSSPRTCYEQIKRAKEYGIEVGEPQIDVAGAGRAQEQDREAADRRREAAAVGPRRGHPSGAPRRSTSANRIAVATSGGGHAGAHGRLHHARDRRVRVDAARAGRSTASASSAARRRST